MHKVLERQLRRVGIGTNEPPTREQWAAFLERVERSYADADQDRYTLERSIMLSSEEMMSLHERLAAERDRLRALVGCLGDGLIVIDEEQRVVLVNNEAERLLGVCGADLIGKPLAPLVVPPDNEEAFELALRECTTFGGSRRDDDARFVHSSGSPLPVSYALTSIVDDGAAHGAALIFRDIFERIALRHAQKLESVGLLASGVAHELNTPIQFVNDNVHYLQESFEAITTMVAEVRDLAVSRDPELAAEVRELEERADWDYLASEVPQALQHSIEGLQRVAKIVSSMKTFAHNDRGKQAATDINAVVQNTLTVAGHELRSVAMVHEELGDLPSVVCSRSDLSQVLLNLVVNAAHAIGDVVARTQELGRLTVSTRVDGSHVVIAVTDTGGGIPLAVQRHLFEPFFTTKEVGRGTGQGLALARSIVVKKHGGTLDFETELGVGTTFFVRLPIAGAQAANRAA